DFWFGQGQTGGVGAGLGVEELGPAGTLIVVGRIVAETQEIARNGVIDVADLAIRNHWPASSLGEKLQGRDCRNRRRHYPGTPKTGSRPWTAFSCSRLAGEDLSYASIEERSHANILVERPM